MFFFVHCLGLRAGKKVQTAEIFVCTGERTFSQFDSSNTNTGMCKKCLNFPWSWPIRTLFRKVILKKREQQIWTYFGIKQEFCSFVPHSLTLFYLTDQLTSSYQNKNHRNENQRIFAMTSWQNSHFLFWPQIIWLHWFHAPLALLKPFLS